VLSALSRQFFDEPPLNFTDHHLIEPRPALTVARLDQDDLLRAKLTDIREFSPAAQHLPAAELAVRLPGVRVSEDGIWCGILDHRACHLDGHGLLHGYLRGVRQNGGCVVLGAAAEGVDYQKGRWRVRTPVGEFGAAILLNASGGWGDCVAELAGISPLGLSPRRRTIVTFDEPVGVHCANWPFVRSIDDSYYFVPESGGLLLSPADETAVEPSDVQPEELDVAVAIDRFETVTGLRITRIRSKWAGLRTFLADRIPAVGFDPLASGFFWYVGQGGVGLQTSPALSATAESLIIHDKWPQALASHDVPRESLAPRRLSSCAL
jgi:D-arginine dehydrogenase